jgi:hypothetical protein
MAITIVKQQAASKMVPAFNPVNFTLNSTNNGSCNFRYVTEIYINNIFRVRLKTFPDPSTGFGFVQIGRIIEDYMMNYAPTAGSAWMTKSSTAPGPFVTVYCKFGEEYDSSSNCTGAVVTYPNLSTSNTFYAFNAALDYEVWPSFDYTNFLIGTASSTTKQFLTQGPREIEATFNDSLNLTFLSNATPANAKITYYKKDGTTTLKYIGVTASNSGLGYWNLNCGPYDLNLRSTGINLFPNGPALTLPDITGSTDRYEIVLINSSTQSVSETITVKIKEPKEFRTRIGWIGLYGNPERYTFYHRNRLSYNIERREYKKNMFRNIGNEWTYAVGDRGRTSLANITQEQHTVSTFARKEDSEWLTQLWLSNEAWVEEQPDIFKWRVFRSGTSMIFQVPPNLNLKVGDKIWVMTDSINYPLYGEYNGLLTVAAVYGPDNVYVDCSLPYTAPAGPFTWNITTEAYGCGVKQESYVRLPIMVVDTTIEEKQRTNKPIEYTIRYDASYEKNTMRG